MKRSLLRLLPAVAAVAALVPATLALGGSAPEANALLPDLDQETPTGLVLTKARGGLAPRVRLGRAQHRRRPADHRRARGPSRASRRCPPTRSS